MLAHYSHVGMEAKRKVLDALCVVAPAAPDGKPLPLDLGTFERTARSHALLRHRHQWVRMRTRVQNALQAIAVSHGLRRGPSLWSQTGQHAIASLPLARHAAHRRNDLQTLYCTLNTKISTSG